MTKYKSWKTAASLSDLSESAFRQYKEAGIEAMEISRKYTDYGLIDWASLPGLSEKYGVKLWSLHLPFSSTFDISSSDDKIREETVKTHIELMKNAAGAGIRTVVVHPSTEPIEENMRGEYMERSKASLRILADEASKLGVTVAVEDLPRTCLGRDVADMLELLSADDRLRVCFDTNHLLRGTHREFVEALGSKIRTLHVSDYDFIDECHLLPGDGDINWTELISLLEAADYSGPFLYEVTFGLNGRKPQTARRAWSDIAPNRAMLGLL